MSAPLVRLAVVAVLLAGGAAAAQCTRDVDCKGDRICVSGSCVSPAASTVAPAPPPPPAPLVDAPPPPPAAADFAKKPMLLKPTHWARPAGVAGLVLGALVLGFGVVSAAFTGDTVPSVGAGAFAFLFAAVGAPIVAVGAASARFDEAITGAPAARIAGWTGYTLAMLTGAAMIILGIADVTFSFGLILAVAALGATSLACLAADGFLSAAQADQLVAAHASAPVRVRPFVALATDARGRFPVFGLAVAF